MMDKRTPMWKMGDAEVIATLLNKEEADQECEHLVGLLMSDPKCNRAAMELGRRVAMRKPEHKVTRITEPQDVYDLMHEKFDGLEQEQFHVILLDTKLAVKKVVHVSTGTANSTIVHPRDVFREAIKGSAVNVVMTHNHPSGDPTPSRDDIRLTSRLVEAGKLLGIEVYDHVIIGGEYSPFLSFSYEDMI